MTEQYNVTDPTTYQSIILTEDGRGLVLESSQGVSSVPPRIIANNSNIVDDNVSVTSVASFNQTTPILVQQTGNLGSITSNIGIIPGTKWTP